MGDDTDGGAGIERRRDAVSRARAGLVAVPLPPPACRQPTAVVPPSPELIAALTATGAVVRLSEPLGRHTSFRIGGPADVFIEVASVPELMGVLRACTQHATPTFFLGGGTNLLVSDRGARGVVVKLGKSFDFVEWQLADASPRLRVGAAVPFKRLVTQTIGEGLAGLEFGEGIPGTVGGGLLMNAGAFGGEIGRVVDAIEAVNDRGDFVVLPRESLGFAYRRLELPMRAIVTAVSLRLERGVADVLAATIREAKAKRDRLQPKGHPNAGSIFKNPPGAPAGKLLEAVGLKGARLGNAMVSLRHANFIVNLGGARATDVKGLMDLAARVVRQRLGVELEPEVRLVGDW